MTVKVVLLEFRKMVTNFNNIQSKLQQFIKKYYTNELIRGLILFLAFGLLYLIFTLYVEYFLWLQPAARRVLFFVFIVVELALLIRFIVIPAFKLIGFKAGITLAEASKIIGNHFPEVDDKLLNVLQLNQSNQQSELLVASIEQKSAKLQPIPFKTAINFKKNVKYLKYLSIPLVIWLFTFISGNNAIFKESLNRVVHYKTAYVPPAPFAFKILNRELSTIEGNAFKIEIETIGEMVPENAQINFNSESYFLRNEGLGLFTHEFNNLKEPVSFYVEANGIRSRLYEIDVLKTPTIASFEMVLKYPNYTKKRSSSIKNTGNAVIPEGTIVTWNVNTRETTTVTWNDTRAALEELKKLKEGSFTFTKRIHNSVNYQIATSNVNLKEFEKLNYGIQTIKDEFPKIAVRSDIDSVSRGPVQFAGQLSDDYSISRLNLVYYNSEEKDSIFTQEIQVNKTSFEEFYFVFDPQGDLNLLTGKSYELYFEVFDNDAVNGRKSSKSKKFRYHNKTQLEINEDLLNEQRENLEKLDAATKKTEKLSEDFKEFSKKLKNKPEVNWNDKKELNQFLKRQEQYNEMFQKQTNDLKENLNEQIENEDNQSLKNKKEELQKRIEETQEQQRKERLLEELQKMAEKLDKEGMIEKLDKLTQRQKQDKRSLERLLEMTKRYYTEKKAAEIANKLDTLAKEQERLPEQEDNNADNQEKLNKKFEEIKKDLEELTELNLGLQQPMDFPTTKNEEKQVDELQDKATDNLKEESSDKEGNNKKSTQNKSTKIYQKSAARKMKQMSESMQQSMAAMQGEMLDENIDDLRAILENLVTFSFDQEQLMVSLEGVDASNASYPVKLKKQQILKEHFEHIDDSLYTLSLRLQQMTAKIQNEITEAHYNIDKSLENIAENRMRQGISNQQYTMTASNNLADLLSNLLNSLQNPSMGSGEGKGKSQSIPDIIKKQGEMSKRMKDGIGKRMEDALKKGKEKGSKQGQGKDSDGQAEQMTGEQYELYQQQQAIREQLEKLLEKNGGNGDAGNKAVQQMKKLEEQLLDKGFDNKVLEQMIQLEYELLKLEEATLKQGKDKQRKSDIANKNYQNRIIDKLNIQKSLLKPNEILNRQPLPLHQIYKKKVKEYFRKKD